jgi:hypothetical protein
MHSASNRILFKYRSPMGQDYSWLPGFCRNGIERGALIGGSLSLHGYLLYDTADAYHRAPARSPLMTLPSHPDAAC